MGYALARQPNFCRGTTGAPPNQLSRRLPDCLRRLSQQPHPAGKLTLPLYRLARALAVTPGAVGLARWRAAPCGPAVHPTAAFAAHGWATAWAAVPGRGKAALGLE